MPKEIAPGQTGDGPWWNEIRREENPAELAGIYATIAACPHCDGPRLHASVPHWCISHDELCPTTFVSQWFDEPEDAVHGWNEFIVGNTEKQHGPG